MLINRETLFRKILGISGAVLLWGPAATATPPLLDGHTRPFVTGGEDLGSVDSTQKVNIRLWLKHKKSNDFSQYVADSMDPRSSKYHQWMSTFELKQKHKPSQDDVEKIRAYLQAKGAQDIKADQGGNYVSASLNAADVESIFKVKLHKFLLQGKPVIANTSDPELDTEIAGQVAYVGGLTTHKMRPMLARQRDLDKGGYLAAQPFTAGLQTGAHETNCFRPVETHVFTASGSTAPSGVSGTPGASGTPASPILASYTGNRYGSDANAAAPNLPPCGYSVANVQQVYGVSDLVKAGLDGRGQTIVIIDAYGSPTIEADVQAFSTANGLPAPDLTIYAPSGPPVVGAWTADQQGWAGETTLDVEWVHAMAPGAKIALVEALSPNDDDLAAAIAYALDHNLGSVVSNSWGGPESEEDPASISLFNILFQTAAAKGVAVNFSSGDHGDELSDGNGGGLGYVDVDFPVSSPFVTGVGGTSLALNSDLSVKFMSGWGTNGMRISDGVATADQAVAGQNAALDPPVKLGFIGGSGGGVSRSIPKPDFQRQLPGATRGVPDVAYLADPYTGVEVIESSFDSHGNPEPGTLTVQVIGGTSLACPMFSAMWAIANQAHGSNLGEAAPLLYALPADAMIDIVPVGSPGNVTGTIIDSTGLTPLNALSLGLPETVAPFLSALYNSPNSPFRWDVITFGTDSTLETAPGWDNVTGLGVPNGAHFIQQFIKK